MTPLDAPLLERTDPALARPLPPSIGGASEARDAIRAARTAAGTA
jgi:hypothetical protein